MVYGIWLQVFDGPEALAHMRRGVAILETREQTAEEEKRGGKAKTEDRSREMIRFYGRRTVESAFVDQQ